MRGIRFILFIMIMAGIAVQIQAQQKSLYSLYMFNYFLINPAAAGVAGTTSINFTSREQWVGRPGGGPMTNSVSAETRILKNSYIAKALNLRKKFSKRSASGRIGVGVHFYNDISGELRKTGMQLVYGYHIPMRQNLLSFGVTIEPYQFNVNKTEILRRNKDPNDLLLLSLNPRYVIDGNFGMQYTAPLWYAGASITDLFQSNIYFGSTAVGGFQTMRHYFLSGGYKVIVNRMIMIEPTSLVKFTERGSFQMDLSARAFYREDYWGGLTYRTGANAGSVIVMAGLKYQRYYFGYAFDYTMSPVMDGSYGSHEFMLTVKFGENARRYRFLNRY